MKFYCNKMLVTFMCFNQWSKKDYKINLSKVGMQN